MARVLALPSRGDVFVDTRGEGRALRVTWHHEAEVVVLSLWRDNRCAGTFRLADADVPALIEVLTNGLASGHGNPTADLRVG